MVRGRERTVICAKCGRRTRRDKAVFIEKAMLQNPVDRKEVYDDQYTFVWKREVGYCASCGKHLRIYEKKINQLVAAKEKMQRYRKFRPPTDLMRQPFQEPAQPRQDQQPAMQEAPSEPAENPERSTGTQ